jgi:MFS family permease
VTATIPLQSRRFLALYALAWAGVSVAYVPLLTLLIPARVAVVAGSDAVEWLAYLTFAGAVAASVAGIACGWFSDLTGGRRAWVAGGMAGSTALLLAMPGATSLPVLMVLLVAWQVCLNAMLGPLAAWAGDTVPDAQKGTLGGLLAFAPAAGAAAGALVTWPGLALPAQRIGIIAALVVASVLPIVLFGRPRPLPSAEHDSSPPSPLARQRAIRMWLARLMVQVSEAALFAYFYMWFRALGPRFDDAAAARLIGAVLVVGAPLALFVGRIADRRGIPISPLRWSAGIAAIGLATMALVKSPAMAIGGYVVFGLSTSVFLALHSAQTLRVLPRPERRGRDLGVFNLTNTVPSLVMPWLTLALVPLFGFSMLFLVLGALAVLALLLLRPGVMEESILKP